MVHRLVKERNNPCLCDGCDQKMDRLISNPNISFKGKDFYVNDFKKPKEMKKQAQKDKKRREEGKSTWREF